MEIDITPILNPQNILPVWKPVLESLKNSKDVHNTSSEGELRGLFLNVIEISRDLPE